MNDPKQLEPMTYEQFRTRERYLMHAIEHCISIIALCRTSGSYKAELSYEQLLETLNDDLRTLRAQQETINQTIE